MLTLPEDFFRPPPPVTISLLKVGGQFPQEVEQLPPSLLATAREEIALRLWGGLAGLARTYTIARGEERCFLAVVEVLPELSHSLCRRLGLPKTEYAAAVIQEDLLGNFFYWLEYERGGEYPAAWGVMRFDGRTLAFSDVHIPRFLSGQYRKAESMRDGQGRRQRSVFAE